MNKERNSQITKISEKRLRDAIEARRRVGKPKDKKPKPSLRNLK